MMYSRGIKIGQTGGKNQCGGNDKIEKKRHKRKECKEQRRHNPVCTIQGFLILRTIPGEDLFLSRPRRSSRSKTRTAESNIAAGPRWQLLLLIIPKDSLKTKS
jgi:hypothetical protein